MKVTQSEFVISAVGPDQYPDDALPEIALAGRSNVGKSSLINKLINRKNLARTSSTPGKTQCLNYYRINEQLYFVDFPGYGYAKVSKTQREAWGKMIERYLLERETLKLVLLVVDLRHPPSKDDEMMYEWLKHYEIPICVVATKADKIPRSRWAKHAKQMKTSLLLRGEDTFIMYSSETGMGKDELWSVILNHSKRDQSNEDEQLIEELGTEE
ncbi:ribosome biogenesis GTP-binding protein YihA/YsxC [Paenibacillus pini]|uniref:Probable GTP-binding protein EngB n=1 Tax=Paenibacillus pini JCM 16418 TaxID=1236976 RepID=W7YGG1_9BACL|nr:ribosome biogenesis GTP-binding protein YihA/YsxC [Paenibacillus pini]GAF10015.1 GTP-binding protein EngB [Paenibacillus pini JCM 16418]